MPQRVGGQAGGVAEQRRRLCPGALGTALVSQCGDLVGQPGVGRRGRCDEVLQPVRRVGDDTGGAAMGTRGGLHPIDSTIAARVGIDDHRLERRGECEQVLRMR